MLDELITQDRTQASRDEEPFLTQSPRHLKMMKAGCAVRVRIIENRNDRTEEGVIRIQVWDRRDRMLRAFKFLAMCWGAALVAIFIPLLHFFLVPAFLIAGPVVAYFVAGQDRMVLGGEGVCPSCHAPLVLARASVRFPMADLCTRCQSSLKIENAEDF